MPQSADRHLLFGLLALQNGLIRQDQLVAAFHAWTLDKARPLDEHLLAPGYLNDAQKNAIAALVAVHAETHGGDFEQSLASLTAGNSTLERLAAVADPDLDATLTHVGRSALATDQTGTFHPGAAASVGLRFRVLRPHARGGLGAVYVALDSELNREVALKQILANHADNPVLRGRFLVEAEITGGLEHPGIVPVYGLGKYDDGRPYYAMRFILGKTLKETIEQFRQDKKSDSERSLDFRRLLKNFTDVCNAIDYAHSRGVLHRDIKPGNVIVGNHGETLVVDWGLAKALGQSAPDAVERTLIPSSGDGSSETLPGQALGTPAYMSPEQARGDLEKLGPRCDIYSLGATLYYLLTGESPFSGDPGSVLRAVESGDFKRPRDRDGSIDPALEAIALKAMAKEPSARYGSAKALANEIDRWLADERVEAYPEPWTRSLIRWLTRHRTGVTSLAAAGIVALIGLGIVSTVQTRARRDLDAKNTLLDVKNGELTQANTDLEESNRALDLQRKRAETNEVQAIDAVKRFKDAIVNNPELKDNPSLKSLRKTLLKEPLAFFSKLAERLQADADTRSESLSRLADVAFAHALLVNEIGDKQDAIAVYQHALEIFERLARDHPDATDYQADLAISHNNLGLLRRATGQNDEARAAFERALAILDPLTRDHPTVAEYQAKLAASHHNLGSLLSATGRNDEARAAFEQSLAIRERLVRDHPADTGYQSDLATSYNNLGLLFNDTGQIVEARAAFERALAIRERLVRDHPAVAEYQSDLAATHHRLGNLFDDTGHPDEARAEYARAIEVRERLARDHPDVSDYQARLATSHNNLGNVLSVAGRGEEARAAFQRALEVHERLAREHPDAIEYQANLAANHINIGNLLLAMGRHEEAQTAYERALEVQERLAREHPNVSAYPSAVGAVLSNLAAIDFHASRFAEARERVLQAITWQKKALEANPRNPQYRQFFQNHLNGLSLVERALGHEAEAAQAERELAEFRLLDPMLQALDARLKAVREGDQPKDTSERLALAQRAHVTRQFRLAARLGGEALEANPKLTEDRQAQRAYNAACAATLAADGQGDDPPGDDAEKLRLRGKALGWLQSELAVWSKFVEAGQPQGKQAIASILRHWQTDADLASVREPEPLARLPEPEQAAWKALWERVTELLRQVE